MIVVDNIKFKDDHNGVIYLSGGMEHTSPDDPMGAVWRKRTSSELNILGYYPLNIADLDIVYQQQCGDLFNVSNCDDTVEQALSRKKAAIRKHFIHTDLRLIIHDSDAVIVYYDDSVRKGAGTIGECQTAFNNDIPIFIVSSYDSTEDIPSWLVAISTKLFFNFKELYQYLSNLPEKILRRDRYGNHHSGEYYLCSLTGEPFKKEGLHFASNINPLYNKQSVSIVQQINTHPDRYNFIIDYLTES